MNHQEAQTMNAPERYVMNEMPLEDRDAFEEHYFDCLDCARDVREWASFVDSTKAVARSDNRFQRPPMKAKALRTATYAVAGAMALVVAWQGVVIQGLRVAQREQPAAQTARAATGLGEEISFVGIDSRAEGELQTADAGRPIVLRLELPQADAEIYRHYEAKVFDAKNVAIFSQEVTNEQANDTFHWVVGSLPAGDYRLVVEGLRREGSRAEMITGRFTVKRP